MLGSRMRRKSYGKNPFEGYGLRFWLPCLSMELFFIAHALAPWNRPRIPYARSLNAVVRCNSRHFGVYQDTIRGFSTLHESSNVVEESPTTSESIAKSTKPPPCDYLILWRGEAEEGRSRNLRHLEFGNALAAVQGCKDNADTFTEDSLLYRDALRLESGTPDQRNPGVGDWTVDVGAMQFLRLESDGIDIALINAARRCSLVRDLYRVVARASTYAELAQRAIRGGLLDHLMTAPKDANTITTTTPSSSSPSPSWTWCLRLREYDDSSKYGRNVRSPLTRERKVILEMADLIRRFEGGTVDLVKPDVKLYVLEGLYGGDGEDDCCDTKFLVERLAEGPKLHSFAPIHRICVTNTPLDPVSAFSMCNAARVRPGSSVFDPFCGSATTLLAAAALGATYTAGVELAHSGHVNFDDVYRDFQTRGIEGPTVLIRGDCTDSAVREKARPHLGGFDAIVTDPPYGLREKKSDSEEEPLVQLVREMGVDRIAGTPLLATGGRLVAFVPLTRVVDEDDDDARSRLFETLPSLDLLEDASLVYLGAKEQYLNDGLSRWMVCYTCV